MDVTPQGFRTLITATLSVRNGPQAIAFYKDAFGAVELHRVDGDDGTAVAQLAVSGAEFWVADRRRRAGGTGIRSERRTNGSRALTSPSAARDCRELLLPSACYQQGCTDAGRASPTSEVRMRRVTGIGGIFMSATDPKA